MSRIIDYKVDHLDLFELEDESIIENLKYLTLHNKIAKTILIHNKPIIATGLNLINEFTGQIWMIKSKELTKHKIEIIKLLKVFIKKYAKKYSLKRIHTKITKNEVKWIEFLGFERESEMINFQPGIETYIYRRLF